MKKSLKTFSGYKTDEEGYIEIEFVHSDLVLEEQVDEISTDSEKTKLAKEETERRMAKHKDVTDKGLLTGEYILSMSFSDIARLAMYPPAADTIRTIAGFRGMPLKEEYNLLPHQDEAVAWMRRREALVPSSVHGLKGGLIRLTQGLGKTLTALALILTSPKGEFPSLVVCSKTVMNEWKEKGVAKFFGNAIRVLYFHKDFIGKKNFDAMKRSDLSKYDVVITTYDVCTPANSSKKPYVQETFEMGDDHTLMKGKIVAIHSRTKTQANNPEKKGQELLFYTPWERIICDESHRFASPDTATYRCIMALYGEKKWCLTGTPIRNYETDIWAQLRFCGYTTISQTVQWKKACGWAFQGHRLSDAIFSMNYSSAQVTLPPKTEYFNPVFLDGNHKIFYEWMLGETINTYDEMMAGGCSFASVLAMFTRLRQCAIAPYLTTRESKRQKGTSKEKVAEKEAVEKIKKRFANSDMYKWLTDKKTDSGIMSVKIREIVSILKRIPKNEKVLVFSMFTSCTDLLADAIEEHFPEFSFVQVDGDVVGQDRSNAIDKFRTKKSIRGLFMTYKVGSEGLNLVEATHCICIEPWWTNAVHDQAKARCWRMGQTKPVYIHNIFVQNTIEEKVHEICKGKDEMAASFLEGTDKPIGKVGLDKFTLGKILGIR